MKRQKKTLSFLTVTMMGILLAGCVQIKSQNKPQPNLGIYKSFDKGREWNMISRLVSGSGFQSIANVNVRFLRMDPQDNNALYVGTENHGLLYSFNGGEYWQQPPQLSSGRINDLAIHPSDKCTIFVAYGHRVMRSTDCNRSWDDIYIDDRPETVTSVVVDTQHPQTLYAATSFGEIIKSEDDGSSWRTIKRFHKTVQQLLLNNQNPSILYVLVQDEGIFKTDDKGRNWKKISSALSQYKDALTNAKIFLDPTRPDDIYLIGKYGIFSSVQNTSSWKVIELITPPGSITIYSFAVNPVNGREIYYGTANTLKHSTDGGENWSVSTLPTPGAASALLVDPVNPSIIYLGAQSL